MLDLKFVREFPDKVKENNSLKRVDVDVDAIIKDDEKRRAIIADVERLKNERNVATKLIAEKKKNKEDAEEDIKKMREVSDTISAYDNELRIVEERIQESLMKLPNILHDSVPKGMTEEDNKVIRTFGNTFEVNHNFDHIEIGKKLNIIDFERGAKVTGSGFAFLTGKGAKLERALINFFLDENTAKGYTEFFSPFIVNQASMEGTGQLPKMAEDMYHCTEDNLYLIPTAEVPLTNYHNNEMLKGEQLPIMITGYSPCFRREAGSHGKEVRGFLRVHQFNKVELVKLANPDDSFDELEKLTSNAEDLIKKLGLTYRVLLLCSGDTSFASAKTYDFEVWAGVEKRWLEVSSCSNFLDFQARRANIRFKRSQDSKPEFVHTLNGSGLATPRIIVAILEQYFDGEKLVIPEVLRKYTGFDVIEAE
jgi:seryl-tRNA synthetase